MESERHEQYLQFASCKLIRILDQGSGEVFLVKSEIQKIFAGTIRNRGLWNPEFSSRNPLSCQRLESGSKFHWRGIQNPVSSIRNPQSKTALDYLTSVGQHSSGTSDISPQFNSPAANHSSFIPYKVVIIIYMPKGQGWYFRRWRKFN